MRVGGRGGGGGDCVRGGLEAMKPTFSCMVGVTGSAEAVRKRDRRRGKKDDFGRHETRTIKTPTHHTGPVPPAPLFQPWCAQSLAPDRSTPTRP